MAYQASIVADSVSTSGNRVTTFVVRFWRCMLSEFNTHRVFSRNSTSSRAIPVYKQLREIMIDPFIPAEFGVNKPGMQAGAALSGQLHDDAVVAWLEARDNAVFQALKLITSPDYIETKWIKWCDETEKGEDFTAFVLDICDRVVNTDKDIFGREDLLAVHKGLANRLLEPFMWHTVIVTATEWENFFALRVSPDAQQEIRIIAEMMKELYDASTPELLNKGEWHLPFLQPSEREWAKLNPEEACLAVSARCARVSYLTHDTGEADLTKDLILAERLRSSGHNSPFEHVATPEKGWSGNFHGWKQFRKTLKNEDNFSKVLTEAA
jgi:Thymidylate synthase complementing protein